MYNFTLRIHQDTLKSSLLGYFRTLYVSNILILNKPSKFTRVVRNKDVDFYLNWKQLYIVSGSNSYPVIAFKGDYLDITFRNFPRYPIVNHFSYTERSSVKTYIRNLEAGYQIPACKGWTEYRKVEILNLTKSFSNQKQTSNEA